MKFDLVKNEMDNYQMIDLVKYIAAILVICIHCNPIVPQPQINYFIKQTICRLAVPFFFMSSAFFVRRGMQKKTTYLTGYLANLVRSYLFWSLLFIPIGMDWMNQNLQLANHLKPFALIFGLIHVGTYYHLWYIPAMILSLFVVAKLLKYFSYKVLLIVSFLLYGFGSLETYYGFLKAGWLKDFFDRIIKIFFTTRSGLLFGMSFIVIGFFIYDHQEKLRSLLKYVPFLTLLFASLLIAEGVFLYDVKRLDMNFLLMLLPFSFFFFIWVLAFSKQPSFDTKKLRNLSQYYYFIHPICIVLVEEFGVALKWPILTSGIISFGLIFLITHFLSVLIIRIQMEVIQFPIVVKAGLLGVLVTFVLASSIYAFKTVGVTLKFELVPSIWLMASIFIYYFIQKKKPNKEPTTG